MEKRAIVIQGIGNSGKTATARVIIQKLLENGFQLVDYDNHRKEPKDMRALLEKDDKTVAVCTAGDNEKIMERNLKFIKDHNCNNAILFSRTGEKTKGVVAIIEYFKNKNVIWHNRWSVNYSGSKEMEKSLRIRANDLQASEIVNIAMGFFGF